MPFGIINATAPNLTQITNIANNTDYVELMIKVNHDIYNGYLYFSLLCVFWIILFWAANERNNQILQNLLFSGFVVSIISLFLRAAEIYYNGLNQGLITDRQMWMFPVITGILALVLWMIKKREAG